MYMYAVSTYVYNRCTHLHIKLCIYILIYVYTYLLVSVHQGTLNGSADHCQQFGGHDVEPQQLSILILLLPVSTTDHMYIHIICTYIHVGRETGTITVSSIFNTYTGIQYVYVHTCIIAYI